MSTIYDWVKFEKHIRQETFLIISSLFCWKKVIYISNDIKFETIVHCNKYQHQIFHEHSNFQIAMMNWIKPDEYW